MHKSERLFQLVDLLKGRRLAVTAKSLANHFTVSERTIYRDIQDLQSSGVPIEGKQVSAILLVTTHCPL